MTALPSALSAATAELGGHPLVELETGRLSQARFLDALSDALEAELGRRVPIHDMPDRLWADLTLNTAFLDELRRHRDTGLRLALLTNNVREWEPHWRALFPVDDAFEVVVDSAFVGMRKPDRDIYELTLDRLRLAPEQCVFIDDLEINIAGAANVGLHTVHFRDTEQASAELRAHLAQR